MEIWKDIIGYEGLYQVSNLGRVKALAKTFKGGNGGVHYNPDKILKPAVVRGYSHTTLTVGGKPKIFKTHRLVALAFLPNPETKKQVNHINGNKLNNHLSNLEWCTCGENHRHAYRTKLRVKTFEFDHPRSRMVLNTETGIYYGSGVQAALAHGYNPITLQAQLSGRNRNTSPMIYI